MAAADSDDFAIGLARRRATLVTPAMYEQGLAAMRAIAATVIETRVLDPELYPEHSGNPDPSAMRDGQTHH